MRVVIDSNVLVSAIGRRSPLRIIWTSFRIGKFDIVLAEDILKEYEEILQEHAAPGASDYVLEMFMESPDVVFQNVYYKWEAISNDPEDNKFFDVAVASGADYLVTDDRHFNIAKRLPFPKVNIISSKRFVEVLEK